MGRELQFKLRDGIPSGGRRMITLAERVEVTNLHWEVTKKWIESRWLDNVAYEEMERLRLIIMGWSK